MIVLVFIVNNNPTFLMDYSRGEGLPSSVLKMGELAFCSRIQTTLRMEMLSIIFYIF